MTPKRLTALLLALALALALLPAAALAANPPIRNLSARLGDDQKSVVISWTPYEGTAKDIRVTRTENNMYSQVLMDHIDPSAQSITDSRVTAGNTYKYTVYANDFSNMPIAQAVTDPITVPGKITDFSAERNDTGIVLSWSMPAGCSFVDVQEQWNDGSWYYTVHNLLDTSYYCGVYEGGRVRYRVRGGNETAVGEWVYAEPILLPPGAPSSTAEIEGDGIRLNWADAATAESYNIRRRCEGGQFETIATGVTGNTYLDEDLIGGKGYDYAVRGVNEAGVGTGYIIGSITAPPQHVKRFDVFIEEPVIGEEPNRTAHIYASPDHAALDRSEFTIRWLESSSSDYLTAGLMTEGTFKPWHYYWAMYPVSPNIGEALREGYTLTGAEIYLNDEEKIDAGHSWMKCYGPLGTPVTSITITIPEPVVGQPRPTKVPMTTVPPGAGTEYSGLVWVQCKNKHSTMEGYETDPTTYLMSSPVFEEGWYYIAIPMDGPQKDFGETYIWTPDTPGITIVGAPAGQLYIDYGPLTVGPGPIATLTTTASGGKNNIGRAARGDREQNSVVAGALNNGTWNAWTTKSSTLTELTYSDTAVTPGTVYQYRVRGRDGSAYGAFKTGTSVTALAAVPGAISSVTTKAEAGKITVNWVKATNAAQYIIQRRVKDGTVWTTLKSNIVTTTYEDTTGTAGTIYQYRVRGRNGTTYGPFKLSSVVRFIAGSTGTKPGAISSVTATPTAGKITVKWTASSGADTYLLQRQVDGGAWTTLATVSTLTYTDTMVTKGTKYAYRVRPKNEAGYGTFKACSAVTAK